MKQMGDEGAAERTLFMRNAIRSPRYGVEVSMAMLTEQALQTVRDRHGLQHVGIF